MTNHLKWGKIKRTHPVQPDHLWNIFCWWNFNDHHSVLICGQARKLIEIMDLIKLIKLGISELLATATLIFICCLGCVKTELYTPTLMTIVFILCLDVILVLNIFIKISGAHINPAITVAAFVYKLVDLPVRKN